MINSANDRIDEATTDATDDGYIIGEVVDNVDPDGIGRVKVKIPQLFDIGQSAVPWIGAHRQSPFGFGPNFGVYGSPQVGSKIRVKFQEGSAHYGLSEADEYNKAIANSKFKTPDTWGFKDPSGSELFVNLTTKAWEFTHASGTTIKYNAQGDETIHIIRNRDLTVDGTNTENVTGDQVQVIKGSLNITVTGEIAITTNSQVSIVAGGNIDLTASGTVNISGSTVNLN